MGAWKTCIQEFVPVRLQMQNGNYGLERFLADVSKHLVSGGLWELEPLDKIQSMMVRPQEMLRDILQGTEK